MTVLVTWGGGRGQRGNRVDRIKGEIQGGYLGLIIPEVEIYHEKCEHLGGGN